MGNRKYSTEALIEDIKSVADRTDRSLTRREYNSEGMVNSSTILDRFGSWNEAKEKAGLKKSQRTDYLSKYYVEEDFFTVWNEKSAYIFGYFLADGNIYNNALTFKVTLKKKPILEQIKTAVGTDKPVREVDERVYQLRVNSQRFTEPLRERGYEGAKTTSLSVPEDLPDELYSHFLRGYFDGDGTAGNYCLAFDSIDREFLESLSRKNAEILGLRKRDVAEKDNLTSDRSSYRLDYFGEDVERIQDEFYPAKIFSAYRREQIESFRQNR